ncbi:MAG: hypothetical protein BAJATHORv1_10637 [Candidatus Thorarchaeota archaeon]|nr:MAG: hypothetical protein BAJATHORv1_10637 [Candidatus Thorarchaeota archaeon]
MRILSGTSNNHPKRVVKYEKDLVFLKKGKTQVLLSKLRCRLQWARPVH